MAVDDTGKSIRITVNGSPYRLDVHSGETLLEVIRQRLALRGTKRGCEIGECGACTVVMNGKAVNSCLILAVQADGAEVVTVEGLGRDGELHPLQEAFLDAGAVQCGYCTPGALMSAYALLEEDPDPTPEKVRAALAGNLCRCTGYQTMIDAVLLAARRMCARGPAFSSKGQE